MVLSPSAKENFTINTGYSPPADNTACPNSTPVQGLRKKKFPIGNFHANTACPWGEYPVVFGKLELLEDLSPPFTERRL